MQSKALEAYLALERAHMLLEGRCDTTQTDEVCESILHAMDLVWWRTLTDAERAWLDGRKDDGKAKA